VHQGGHYWWSRGSLHRSSWLGGRRGRLRYRPTRSEQAKIYAFAIDASASIWPIGVRSIDSLMPVSLKTQCFAAELGVGVQRVGR
jgi:hypothetical protein